MPGTKGSINRNRSSNDRDEGMSIWDFKAAIINMLKCVKENINIMRAMKDMKNSLHGFNRRLNTTEEKVSECKDCNRNQPMGSKEKKD